MKKSLRIILVLIVLSIGVWLVFFQKYSKPQPSSLASINTWSSSLVNSGNVTQPNILQGKLDRLLLSESTYTIKSVAVEKSDSLSDSEKSPLEGDPFLLKKFPLMNSSGATDRARLTYNVISVYVELLNEWEEDSQEIISELEKRASLLSAGYLETTFYAKYASALVAEYKDKDFAKSITLLSQAIGLRTRVEERGLIPEFSEVQLYGKLALLYLKNKQLDNAWNMAAFVLNKKSWDLLANMIYTEVILTNKPNEDSSARIQYLKNYIKSQPINKEYSLYVKSGVFPKVSAMLE